MKKRNVVIFGLMIVAVAIAWFVFSSHEKQTVTKVCGIDTVTDTTLSREDTINAMAMAFAQQESRFNHTAVSPCGQWVGCLQLSEIMVDEANRILGWNCFNYSDRFDRQGSYAIFRIVQEKRNKNLKIDRAIDLWNPNCPAEYRNNVKIFFHHNLQNYNNLDDYFMLK